MGDSSWFGHFGVKAIQQSPFQFLMKQSSGHVSDSQSVCSFPQTLPGNQGPMLKTASFSGPLEDKDPVKWELV